MKFDPNGQEVASWGAGGFVFTPDGPLTTSARFGQIIGITLDSAGNPVFSDGFFPRVRRINLTANRLETIAGIFPALLNENGPALGSPINNDNVDIAFDANGELLITDFRRHRPRSAQIRCRGPASAGGSRNRFATAA